MSKNTIQNKYYTGHLKNTSCHNKQTFKRTSNQQVQDFQRTVNLKILAHFNNKIRLMDI